MSNECKISTEGLLRVPSTCGCKGCVFDDEPICPAGSGEGLVNVKVCSDDTGDYIFIKSKNDKS